MPALKRNPDANNTTWYGIYTPPPDKRGHTDRDYAWWWCKRIAFHYFCCVLFMFLVVYLPLQYIELTFSSFFWCVTIPYTLCGAHMSQEILAAMTYHHMITTQQMAGLRLVSLFAWPVLYIEAFITCLAMAEL